MSMHDINQYKALRIDHKILKQKIFEWEEELVAHRVECNVIILEKLTCIKGINSMEI